MRVQASQPGGTAGGHARQVLIYVDECIWPVYSGFHRRAWQVIDDLQALGSTVCVVSRRGRYPDRCRWSSAAIDYFASRDIELVLAPFGLASLDFWWSVLAMIARKCLRLPAIVSPQSQYYVRPQLFALWRQLLKSRRWDAAIVNHAIHHRLARIARETGVFAVLEMHDLLRGQLAAQSAMTGIALSPASQARFADEEHRALSVANVVLAISPDEAAAIRPVVSAQVQELPFCQTVPDLTQSAISTDLLIVGSWTEFNRRGLREFLRGTWPELQRRKPDLQLSICGRIGEELGDHDWPNITWHRQVPDLTPHYLGAKVVLLVTVAGTGVKIKTIEALAHGCCILAHPHSLLGTHVAPGRHGEVMPDLADAAGQILDLLSDDVRRMRYQAAARVLFDETYSREHSTGILCRLLHQTSTTSTFQSTT